MYAFILHVCMHVCMCTNTHTRTRTHTHTHTREAFEWARSAFVEANRPTGLVLTEDSKDLSDASASGPKLTMAGLAVERHLSNSENKTPESTSMAGTSAPVHQGRSSTTSTILPDNGESTHQPSNFVAERIPADQDAANASSAQLKSNIYISAPYCRVCHRRGWCCHMQTIASSCPTSASLRTDMNDDAIFDPHSPQTSHTHTQPGEGASTSSHTPQESAHVRETDDPATTSISPHPSVDSSMKTQHGMPPAGMAALTRDAQQAGYLSGLHDSNNPQTNNNNNISALSGWKRDNVAVAVDDAAAKRAKHTLTSSATTPVSSSSVAVSTSGTSFISPPSGNSSGMSTKNNTATAGEFRSSIHTTASHSITTDVNKSSASVNNSVTGHGRTTTPLNVSSASKTQANRNLSTGSNVQPTTHGINLAPPPSKCRHLVCLCLCVYVRVCIRRMYVYIYIYMYK
jgi:hypothetical protein